MIEQILEWPLHKIHIFILKWGPDLSKKTDEDTIKIIGLLQELGQRDKARELQEAILFNIRRKQRQTAGD